MAKKFGGFTPKQQQTLLSKMGYTGPAQQDDINKFVMSNPKAASMLSRSADMAKARIAVADVGFQTGGLTTSPGVGKVLMEKYGYTMQDGMYFAPTPAAATPAVTPTPAATPAAVTPTPTPAATPATPAAVTPTPTPAATPAAATPTPSPVTPAPAAPELTGTNKILVEKYGWEYDPATGKAFKPGLPSAPAAVTPAPTPTPTPEPTGTDKILVEKFGWSFDPTTGKAFKPGTPSAPAAVTPAETPQPVAAEQPVAAAAIELPKINDKSVINSAPAIGADGSIIPGVITVTYSDGTKEQITNEVAQSAGIDTQNIEDLLSKQLEDQKILTNVQNYGTISVKEISPGIYKMFDKNGVAIPDAPRATSYSTLDYWAKTNGFTFTGGSAEASTIAPSKPVETTLTSTTAGAVITSVFDPDTQNTTYKVISPTGSVQTFGDFAAAQEAMGVFQAKEFDLPGSEAVQIREPGLEGTEGEFTTEGVRYAAFADPGSIVRQADAVKIQQDEAQRIADEAGAAAAIAEQADVTTAAAATEVAVPTAPDITQAAVTATQADVQSTVDKLVAATGKPSDQALTEAATMSPEQLAQLGLTAAQIQEAVQVQAPTPRVEMAGEMIEGPTVDMARVEQAVNFEAATGAPSTDATVQGQLTQLMSQFEDGQTPPWAAGAMRNAAATMAARGLSASSMAGQAIVQAAMESALPIAMQDAQTVAQFESQNLSNRQQAAMFAAEQRAKFLGMEFDQAFQTRVQNASRIADIANLNFTAEQQIALENARITSSTDLANLNAKNAKVLADAAAMTQIDTTNLSNIMKANVDRANAFLQMDMSNLSNEQQATIFKTQSLVNSLLTDAAANNASSQFNAASQNQLDQFILNMTSDITRFNAEQKAAIDMFNAGETNALDQFNTSQQNARDQFNAQNALLVAQANAVWQQAIATADTAAMNQNVRDGVLAQNNLTMQAYANMIQMERDMLDYVWRTSDNALARENSYLIAEMQGQASVDQARGEGTGTLVNTALNWLLNRFT